MVEELNDRDPGLAVVFVYVFAWPLSVPPTQEGVRKVQTVGVSLDCELPIIDVRVENIGL